MAVDDPQDFEQQRISQEAKLEKLPEDKRKPIVDYVKEEIDINELKESTLTNRISKLRILSQNSEKPLDDMSVSEIKSLIREMASDRNWSNGTKRNYQKSVRRFLKVWVDRSKSKRITLTKTDTGGGSDKIDVEELPDAEELRKIIVDESRNLRDKAMFSFMVETGCRISACLSLQIKDIDFGGGAGGSTLVHFRNATGLKGAEGKTIPINYTVQFLKDYLREEHPDHDNENAPLFTKSKQNYREGEDNSLHPSLIRRRLTRITEDLDIEVNPHMLRHVRITNMRKQGWPDHLIKHYVALDENTNQLKRYSHVQEEEKNEQIAELQGLDIDEDEYTPEIPECPNCGYPVGNDIDFNYCLNCGQQLELYDYPQWFNDWMNWREEAGLEPQDRIYEYFLEHPYEIYEDYQKIQEDTRLMIENHIKQTAKDFTDLSNLPPELPRSIKEIIEEEPIGMRKMARDMEPKEDY